MPHPSKLTDAPKARIKVDQLAPPDRMSGEMLNLLSKIVNRRVERLWVLTKCATIDLDPMYSDELDQVLDQVLKLSRAEHTGDIPAKIRSMSDAQLLELKNTLTNDKEDSTT